MGDVISRYQLVRTHRDDFFVAAALTRPYPLKAYDAVQLAVALHQSQVLAAHGLTLTFVSGGGILLAAAQAEGLSTDNPSSHVSLSHVLAPKSGNLTHIPANSAFREIPPTPTRADPVGQAGYYQCNRSGWFTRRPSR